MTPPAGEPAGDLPPPPPRRSSAPAAGKSGGGAWSDLSRRVASTVVLLGIGVAIALATGIWLRLFISAIVAITFWELARVTGWRHPEMHATLFGRMRPVVLALLAGLTLMAVLTGGAPGMLAIPIVIGLIGAADRDRVSYAIFGLAILLVGDGLVHLREGLGLGAVLWTMGVVVISDTLGYFVGRTVGGPKFWPALSPKKTWSGTIAGWIGAALFGALLVALARGGIQLILLSPLVALAGQMGDIAESWLKRRAGVKDSSNLIPGHGGFMDRFDAVCGAVLMVSLLDLVGLVPIEG
ncbi:phosphatidate cytidylyltransferase [Paracoccus suum]|uniref:Phosphatidate cytidylyltransferase n=1 Tax=Paracoccus suum TaxID=2259340 RepID=A0A344PJ69_9RHOB|nr:phosphatidate cytidylyltransferase [Paracoccus suum]AXC49424.1 phosphatidate cytidylyltransferase [Paracoccus suum]